MTQHEKILAYIAEHNSITIMECYEKLHITKLQTRLGELRSKGYEFTDEWETNGTSRYKRYYAVQGRLFV